MPPNEVSLRTNEKAMDKLEEDHSEPGHESYDVEGVKKYKLTTDMNYKHEFIWPIVITMVLLHVGALYGFYLIVFMKLKLLTFIWGCFLGFLSCEGIVLGSHRGYSHNSFKLTTFGQVIIIILQTLTGQKNVYWWVRDHRLHHKFVDTDADPYNAKRGFFFSHIGWIITRKHALVREKGKTINMSDIEANKIIMFQKKYYLPMFILFCIVIPIAVPVYGWNEDFWICFFTVYVYRYVHVLNATWCTNSVAHMFGARPFDKRLTARMSRFTDIVTFGDGWHNYHHVYPWDYTMSEFGYYGGISTRVIHFLHRIGIAYDLKRATRNLVYKQTKSYGDGTITEKDFNYDKNDVK